MTNQKLLSDLARAGDLAADALNHPGVKLQLDALVKEFHDKLFSFDMANDHTGSNSKLAIIAYSQALALRDRLLKSAADGESAQKILNRELTQAEPRGSH